MGEIEVVGIKSIVPLIILLSLMPMAAAEAPKGTEKVVVVGLDGASADLMRTCMEQHGLPNIEALAVSGSFTEMHAPLPPLTPVAMSSFLTGKNPGGHGVYGFEQQDMLSYDTHLVNARDLDTMLPREVPGQSIMVNVPMTYPAPDINGVVVSGFPGSTQGKYVYPPTLKPKLQEMDYKVTTAGTFQNQKELEREVFNLFEKRRNLTLDLMAEYDWNFTMVMFTGDARLLHFTSPEDCGGAIGRYYQELDGFIGTLQERVDDDTTIILMSNHGFQKLDKKIYLYTFLKKHGYLKPKTVPYYKHWVQDFLGGIASFLGLESGGEISGRASFSSKYLDEIDWDNTKAYTGAFYNGQIFLNVKGREPNGVVPQDRYEEVRQNIIEDLKQLRDPVTGEHVVENIYTKEELYNGSEMEDMPDIVIETPGYNHIARFGFGKTFLRDPVEQSAPVKEGFLLMNRTITADTPTIIDLSTTIAGLLGAEFGEGNRIIQSNG